MSFSECSFFGSSISYSVGGYVSCILPHSRVSPSRSFLIMSIPVDPSTDLKFLWERVSEGKWLHLASLASLPPKHTRCPDHRMGSQLEKEPGLDWSVCSFSMTNYPKCQQLEMFIELYSLLHGEFEHKIVWWRHYEHTCCLRETWPVEHFL